MDKKNWITGALLLTALVAGLAVWGPWSLTAPREGEAPATASTHGATAGAGPVVAVPSTAVEGAAAGAYGVKAASAPSSDPLDQMALPVFRATPQGDLAMDSQTRLDVERIHALFGRDEAQARLQEASGYLPDRAQRALRELYQQHAQYAQAVAQTFPPDQGGHTLDDAARQLNGLHDLRQQYFGPERAEALFGEEERISRELLALMRQSKDPTLSLEEKAAQAQEAWRKAHAAQQ